MYDEFAAAVLNSAQPNQFFVECLELGNRRVKKTGQNQRVPSTQRVSLCESQSYLGCVFSLIHK